MQFLLLGMILLCIFGRISFPLFAFTIVEGYVHTRSFKDYLFRIIIAAIFSQIPCMLFNSLPELNRFELNVMFTLAFGLIAIKLYEAIDNTFLKYFCVLSIGILSLIVQADYKMYGVMIIFVLYLFRDSKLKKTIAFILVVTIRYLFRIWYYKTGFSEYMIKMWLFTLVSLIFILLYNRKQGPKLKKFYYWFYPVHMLILYLVSPYTGIIDVF